ncbi:DUF6808 domain-containing protein [Bacteroides fragilis]|uniref:DUF6808 domain-containing protein n=1 Tax=Bacteroides fragilis TaxID=817 RepID=A0AAP9D0F3_BACFG|nr:hypothetical protein [Bacteroides fragilis]MBV4152343.1 hypothetical protein [Bacteroides fragilis]MCE8578993.1 hypothetical protein [Bacteroides fragilis]MCE8649746.1 hypothetical protein [Bacteroides fragilis]MCM0368820.1 hypothetical protein [Bacteroides fragilis]MCS2597567.1 hypothetical protein [Bacteroides fragilis]
MNKNLVIAVLSLLLALSLIFQHLYYSNRNSTENSLKTDTVTVIKTDTVTITKPVIQYRYITQVITDTLYNTDSIKVPVRIPIESKTYQDSTYRAVISGYRASLDTIQIYPIHTITTITNTKQKRFNIGIQAGVGYGCFNKKPDIYWGFGVSYRLY